MFPLLTSPPPTVDKHGTLSLSFAVAAAADGGDGSGLELSSEVPSEIPSKVPRGVRSGNNN